MFTRTKIICTIGPAVKEYDMLLKLIDAGMDIARINFSHGTYDEHEKVIKDLKKARAEKKKPLAIMLDTKGPEIRLGKVKDEPLFVKTFDRVRLTKEKEIETDITVTPSNVIDDLKEGMSVLIDDGYIETVVVEKGDAYAVIEIKNDGEIKSNKGVNIPHEGIDLPLMTERDHQDIVFGCKMGVDLIAASFVCSPEHVLAIKNILAQEDKLEVLVVSKIESKTGVDNFDSILQVSDGIMVARGDLGVELPLTQVPKLQKEMIRKSYSAFKPVVTATQMLESMIKNPRPTRAEVSDVANAIYDSTSAVMLSGETAVGKYPLETVELMKSTIYEAENDFKFEDFLFTATARKSFNDISSSVALASVKTAYSAKGTVLFALTNSGFTARAMSRFRPKMPIIAVTSNEKVYNQLAFNWGVVPVLQHVKNMKEGFNTASCFALRHNLVKYGDLAVATSGSPFGISGTTNTIFVDNIGDVIVRGIEGHGNHIQGTVRVILNYDPTKHYLSRSHIVVITCCKKDYGRLFEQAAGVVLQDHPEDVESSEIAIQLAHDADTPLIVQADGAVSLLREGQLVTMDASKGLIFKGFIETEEEMIAQVCHTD